MKRPASYHRLTRCLRPQSRCPSGGWCRRLLTADASPCLLTGSVVSDWMLRQCTGAPKTATDKCVATFDAATGVMTFTMILLPQTLANALVLEISPDDEEYQSYSNKDMIKPALEAGYSYTYTITVKKTGLTLSGSTIENWNDGGSHAGDAKM